MLLPELDSAVNSWTINSCQSPPPKHNNSRNLLAAGRPKPVICVAPYALSLRAHCLTRKQGSPDPIESIVERNATSLHSQPIDIHTPQWVQVCTLSTNYYITQPSSSPSSPSSLRPPLPPLIVPRDFEGCFILGFPFCERAKRNLHCTFASFATLKLQKKEVRTRSRCVALLLFFRCEQVCHTAPPLSWGELGGNERRMCVISAWFATFPAAPCASGWSETSFCFLCEICWSPSWQSRAPKGRSFGVFVLFLKWFDWDYIIVSFPLSVQIEAQCWGIRFAYGWVLAENFNVGREGYSLGNLECHWIGKFCEFYGISTIIHFITVRFWMTHKLIDQNNWRWVRNCLS